MTMSELKVEAENQIDEDITWFDSPGMSVGIDWITNIIVIADTIHPDGPTIELGTFSDLRTL
jgi:hypothetical protein